MTSLKIYGTIIGDKFYRNEKHFIYQKQKIMSPIEKRILGIKVTEHWFEYNSNQSIFSINPQLYVKDEPRKSIFHIKKNCYAIANNLNISAEQLFAGFNKTYRYQIQKAIKENITCTVENNYEKFLAFYNPFAKEKGLSNVNMDHLTSKEPNLLITFATLGSTVLVTHSYIIDKKLGVARLWLSGSSRLEKDIDHYQIGAANKLLHFKDMLYFKEKGFTTYDFGTYEEEEQFQGLNKFKLSFGGEKLKYSNYFTLTCLAFRKISSLLRNSNY